MGRLLKVFHQEEIMFLVIYLFISALELVYRAYNVLLLFDYELISSPNYRELYFFTSYTKPR